MAKFVWLTQDPYGNTQVAEGGSGYTSTGHVWLVSTLNFEKPVASYVKTKGHLVGQNQVFFNRRKGPYYVFELSRHRNSFDYVLYLVPVDGDPTVIVQDSIEDETDDVIVKAIVDKIVSTVDVAHIDTLRDFISAAVHKSRIYHATGGVWYVRKDPPRYKVCGRYVHTLEQAWQVYKDLVLAGKSPTVKDNKKGTIAWLDVRDKTVAIKLIEKGIVNMSNFSNVRITVATAEVLSTIMLGKALCVETPEGTKFYNNQAVVGYVMSFAIGTNMYFIDTDLNIVDITNVKPETGYDSNSGRFIFKFDKYDFSY